MSSPYSNGTHQQLGETLLEQAPEKPEGLASWWRWVRLAYGMSTFAIMFVLVRIWGQFACRCASLFCCRRDYAESFVFLLHVVGCWVHPVLRLLLRDRAIRPRSAC